MIYLLLSILSSTSIYVTFKFSENFSCKLFDLIVLNYFTATILGFGFLLKFNLDTSFFFRPWLPLAVLVGLLFIGLFFIIGLSSQKVGIAITTIASKMSMVIPVIFSIIYFSETFTPVKIIGLVSAIIAVYLLLFQKGNIRIKNQVFMLPLLIFFGSGLIDTLVKYAQQLKIPEQETSEFTSLVFLVAFISGIIITFFRKKPFSLFTHYPTLIFGFLLGIANYGSLYFLIKALNFSKLESSMVFAINNMSIVVLSTFTGYFLFKEKLSKINAVGATLAFVSIYVLSNF
jgi:drug/metabolite transporter (DMT)-like permease